ncbi:multidrug resistance protein MDR [Cordyceps javanica]|uniref:Multidrug resistance protein MDR n=1 Tax=Cordyceps javanica TaxID=43265 RepID=A0A545UMV4_9HYPO|nr:multidrug resistance protein MDR [Cordyceps javanica]TQW02434.1 multidrug resistance protein MDR [Cordyceps javanica]
MASLAQLDALFGPQLPGHFDFTILFEHSMLWIVPTGVAILMTPFYFNGLLRSERQVRPGFLLWIKVACGVALVGIQACDIALWHNTHYFRSRETVIACSMSLVASICTLAIIIISHLYSLQPSTFLSIFFSITMLFDITMARSYFFRETLGVIAALQVCVVVLKLWLILLEEVPKRSLYRSSYLQATISVEAASGFWGRSFFLWINPILIFGWRSSFTIDTLPDIGEEFASEKLFDLFSSQWTKVSKSSKLSLVYALVRTLRWKLAKVFLPRLCYVGVTIAQPFLLLSTVSAVSSGSISRSTSDGLIGAGAIICFILAISRTLFEHWEYRAVTFIRGILIVAIYDKMQRLRAEDLQGAAAVTLMSVDVDGTETLVSLAYEALSCTLQLSLGIWVLYRFVSVAAFLIFVPTILTFIGSLFTGSMIATARAATNAEAQKRVAATSNILAQIKSIKSMGLSGSLSAYIEHKRENEIKSLARAAFAEEDVIIVDDIFSSVDPDTAATIFERLFGPNGLVRQWNCTVVMSTNRLEILDFADQIYLFSKDGRVTLQNGNEADVSTYSTHSGEDESNEEALGSNRSRISGSDKDTEPPQIQAKKSIEEPESSSGTIDLSLYSYFLRSAGIPALFGWVSFAMISAVGEWAPVLFIRIWFSKSPENKRYFGIYAALAVLCVIFNVASGAFYFKFVFTKITKDMHGRLLRATMGATPQYHNNTDSGVLLNRFGQDISLITRRLALLINQLLFVVFTTLLEIALVASGSAYSVPMILCIVVVLCSIQFFYLRSSRQLRQLELESSAALFTQFTEATDGIQHIRSFGWEEAFRRRLYARLDRSQKPRYLLYCIQRWLTLSTDITSAVATVVIITIATKLPGKTTDAAVGLAMLSLIGFSTTATTFIQYWTSLETSLGAVRRVKQFVINTPQEKDDVSSGPLPVVWPSAGTIDFNALTATYKTSDEKEHTAIENLTVTLRGKQKIGLMGRTGSGKSTVISALLRMVDYTGSISIDGLDTRRVPRELLRSRITTIPQDGLRLNESLRFNLYPFAGERPSDDEMIGALQTVGVWNHARANGGLDANYFKLEFSKGQKQLIFLARAILHQRKTGNRIVLMDEVTSSMAEDAEPELQRLIDVAFSGCTIVMVSHRIESFQTADVILRFSSGKIERVLRRRSNGSLVEG